MCVVEDNYDYLGGDLRAVLNVMSAQACNDLCVQDAACKSWTWGKKPGGALILTSPSALARTLPALSPLTEPHQASRIGTAPQHAAGQPYTNKCHLKSSVQPGRGANDCCTSGIPCTSMRSLAPSLHPLRPAETPPARSS